MTEHTVKTDQPISEIFHRYPILDKVYRLAHLTFSLGSPFKCFSAGSGMVNKHYLKDCTELFRGIQDRRCFLRNSPFTKTETLNNVGHFDLQAT